MSHAEIVSLNLTEKYELISGLRQLYESNGKAEQARRSRELLASGGFLAQLDDPRGNKTSFT